MLYMVKMKRKLITYETIVLRRIEANSQEEAQVAAEQILSDVDGLRERPEQWDDREQLRASKGFRKVWTRDDKPLS